MLKSMTRLVRVILALVLLLTATLYVFANAESLRSLSQALFKPGATESEPTPAVNPPAEIPRFDTPISLDEKEAAAGDPGLPLFVFEGGLDPAVSAERVIFILAGAGRGNLWLARMVGDRWYTEAGPLFCLAGQGLEGRWYTPGALSLSAPADTLWPVSRSDAPESRLELKAEGHTAYIRAGDTGGAAAGGIIVSQTDMLRLVSLLDPETATAACILPASDYGWTPEAGMPSEFVFLTDAVPGISEDARYATRDNFMGRPLEGYMGNRIVLRRQTAEALGRAQADLNGRGLGLLVYDGYRPRRAVDNIFDWIADPEDNVTKERYYPELEKSDLGGIYLAEYSDHIRGIAADVTIIDLETGIPLDMGTGFDFFSPLSWYDSRLVTAQQRDNRALLRQVMERAGFGGYSKEWWHFSYSGIPGPTPEYNFVIPQ
jgi:D-alanyl-D-alanine dipeptidase